MQSTLIKEFGLFLGRATLSASRDLVPIIAVIGLFQMLVLRQPFPELLSTLTGIFNGHTKAVYQTLGE